MAQRHPHLYEIPEMLRGPDVFCKDAEWGGRPRERLGNFFPGVREKFRRGPRRGFWCHDLA
jgi:hypothetical protein